MLQNSRFSLIDLDTDRQLESLASEARAGLTATPKRIPCRFFYDEVGSQIFEEICELPEYYLTRAESEILRERAEAVARRFSLPISLVELGSGSSIKSRVLVELPLPSSTSEIGSNKRRATSSARVRRISLSARVR